jgi:putative ABC transport system permease protein
MRGLRQDVRFTLRSLRRNPGFAAAAILVLGMGIGAISLVFSTYVAAVLRPLPYPRPDRLVWVSATTSGGRQNSLSYDDYRDYRAGADALQELGVAEVFGDHRLLTGRGSPQQVTSYTVSASLFRTLQVTPALGRAFVDDDEIRGDQDVTLLSYGLWKTTYGGDPSLVGRTITVDGRPVQVVGVMPAGFAYPAGSDMWFPLQRSAGYASGRGNNNFTAVGRLRDGSTLEQAEQQVVAVAAGISRRFPDSKAGWSASVVTLHDRFFGRARSSLLLLMCIVALLPLVACTNVASLFLANFITRRREMACRLSLGASRGRLMRQHLTESMVIALAGAMVGLAVAYWGGALLRHLAPAALPRLDQIGVDARVMAFTLAAALVMVPLIGVAPSLGSTDLNLAQALRAGGERGGGDARPRARRALVVAQVALSTVLMLTSGLLLRSYLHLQEKDPGLTTAGAVYSHVRLPAFKLQDPKEIGLAWAELDRRLAALPGVVAVGQVDRPLFSGRGPYNAVWAAQRPPATAADKLGATRRFVSDGYFSAAGISLIRGRTFEPLDERAGTLVTVINRAAAREYFPGENPVGQTLALDVGGSPGMRILGVVGDVTESGPAEDAPRMFYLPAWAAPTVDMNVIIRTRGASTGLAAAWPGVLRAVDPDIPVEPLRTVQSSVSSTMFEPKFRSALVSAFALASLLLSAIGLYGVMAYFVRQRSREIAVRLALGAPRRSVAGLVMARGIRLAGWGLLIGLPLGILAARLVEAHGWLGGVTLSDPVVVLAVGSIVAIEAIVACLLPARRALRTDPATTLRLE